ncbi:rho family-interacting cell polarization regulator 2 [Tachyglossus aculeatus]|uniref:rho family-interacting cell polarization regulator 2 n=1 Tax=Tachyglossus aculeatus TaxID=9261 RepID=UPI0018F4E999|nr:rho family-interacting cell polarization regulator 2 [Tachyglossus aculeatus]
MNEAVVPGAGPEIGPRPERWVNGHRSGPRSPGLLTGPAEMPRVDRGPDLEEEEKEDDDVFGEGVPTQLPEMLSTGPQVLSPGGPNGIFRSQSFAGFSGLQERRSRCNSFIENSSALKKTPTKPKKMQNLAHKSNSSPKEPQPKRVEEVYGALKCGLNEYLEVHQAELDKLNSQLKDMKRNSRLGVLYELDKQIKAIERYMRRLEFHISKVDELYEAYCIQRRLQDGASKMKQAFATSPASRAAKESLIEINRSHKEYTENMCTIETELENLLGEFSIKMKGLAGFARLCPGDQYEIFMRYGRQRWKLKGRIEVNSKQSWDGEDTVFVPLIAGLISIKVTEVKGLATHILVGSVTCETKDLFAARPQVVAVDINDLGTIKLNLEIVWYPFDVEEVTPSAGSGNKASALQRRMSLYSQVSPDTPTSKEQAFFATLPDEIFENGGAATVKSPVLRLSDPSHGHRTPPPAASAHPEITVTPAGPASPEEPPGGGRLFPDGPDSDEGSELKPVELDAFEGNITKQLVRRLTSANGPSGGPAGGEPDAGSRTPDGSLEEAFQGLFLTLDPHRDHYQEFRDLSREATRLDDVLKSKSPRGGHSRGSSLSLAVESALESFDFLNTSDLEEEEDEEEDDGGARVCAIRGVDDSVFSDSETEKMSFRPDPLDGRAHLSEALTEDTGVGTSVAGSPLPLTSGNESLDVAIVGHLRYCTQLVQRVVFSSEAPPVARSLLRKLRQQVKVMGTLAALSHEDDDDGSLLEAIPDFPEKSGLLAFWTACCRPPEMYHASAARVLAQLDATFARTLDAQHPGFADAAFRMLVAQILDHAEMLLPASLGAEPVTVFQYHGYLASRGVDDLQAHLAQLARHASAIQALQTRSDVGPLWEAEGGPVAQEDILRALASLLADRDDDHDEVSQTVARHLAAASENRAFREKATLYYCEELTKANVRLQKSACLALRSLQATEGTELLVMLCHSDREDIRKLASETLLSLGEDGRLAYEQLDRFPRERAPIGGHRGNGGAETMS